MALLHRFSAVLVVAFGLGACALTEDTVKLEYRQMQNVSAVPGAGAVRVSVAVADARSDHRDRVSVKKNGYGMEMAAIRSDRDPTLLVKEAIETELKARGFVLGDGALLAKVDLITFYNDFKIGFFSGDAVADVNLNVQVVGAGGAILYTKPISSQGKAPDILLASGSNAKSALENGLQTAVGNLMADPEFLKALMKAAPAATPVS